MATIAAHAWFEAMVIAFGTNNFNDGELEMQMGGSIRSESIMQGFFFDWDVIKSLHCAAMYMAFGMNLILYLTTYFKHVSS